MFLRKKKHSSRYNKQETAFITDVFGISLGLISVQADDSTWLRILWAAVQTAVHDLQMQHAMAQCTFWTLISDTEGYCSV